MTTRRGFKTTLLVSGGSFLLLLSAATALSTGVLPPVHASPMDIRFIHYTEAGLPEQDVFVEPGDAPEVTPRPRKPHTDPLTGRIISEPGWVSEIIRVEPADAQREAYLSKMLYAANTVVPHDPYRLGPKPLGPFPKGDELGLSLGEWLAARGSGTYAVSGQNTELQLSFEKLVPHGTYRLWCARVTRPPHYASVEKPCGASDGSQNKVQSDANGNASFHLSLKPLPETTAETATVLQLNYTRAIVTQDEELGGYGLNEHVQLYAALPILTSAKE